MKRLCLIVFIILSSSLISFAQKDVTRFMGIPVDGSKSQMIRKLEAKGFEKLYYDSDALTGEFNGRDVTIAIDTYKGKVSRIVVLYVSADELTVKKHYNILCKQFRDNKKYINFNSVDGIPDDEDLSYEIDVNNKDYGIVFFQKTERWGEGDMPQNIIDLMAEKYGYADLADYSDVAKKEAEIMFYNELDLSEQKPVWFTIFKSGSTDNYVLALYYENRYNKPNGEDL